MTARRRFKTGMSPRVLEKDVERMGDRFMAILGFTVVRFSQARATQQTEGIPDRRYYHATKGLAVWWEAKGPSGKQRPAQRAFQVMCEASGEAYLVGTEDVLYRWAESRGLCKVLMGGALLHLRAVSA